MPDQKSGHLRGQSQISTNAEGCTAGLALGICTTDHLTIEDLQMRILAVRSEIWNLRESETEKFDLRIMLIVIHCERIIVSAARGDQIR